MSEETAVVVTTEVNVVDPVCIPELAQHVELAAPTREQIEAANRLFAEQREADLNAGVAGMWTGLLLLHGVIADTVPDEEDEDKGAPVLRPGQPG